MSNPSMWDDEADAFDDAVDHGLRDETARRAWETLLLPLVGSAPRRVADLGCGTGTLSVLLARHGHDVTGVDFSPRMIELARRKSNAAGVDAAFICADASAPPLPAAGFDLILGRHVLWAMPDPSVALRRWADLLGADGTIVLVEGRWHTEAGLTSDQTTALLAEAGFREVTSTPLPDPTLWGRAISDERYVATARRASL